MRRWDRVQVSWNDDLICVGMEMERWSRISGEEELCENTISVRMARRVIAIMMAFEEEVLRLTCGYARKWQEFRGKKR